MITVIGDPLRWNKNTGPQRTRAGYHEQWCRYYLVMASITSDFVGAERLGRIDMGELVVGPPDYDTLVTAEGLVLPLRVAHSPSKLQGLHLK